MASCFDLGRWSARIGVAWLMATFAAAPALAVEVELREPSPCRTDALVFRVERALGQPLSGGLGPRFEVFIERTPSGFAGHVGVQGAEEPNAARRQVTAATCDELIDTLALSVVLAIGAQAATGEDAPDDRSAAAASAAVTPVPAPALEQTSEQHDSFESKRDEPDAASAEVAGTGFVLVDTGSLPAPAPGVAVGFDLAWPALELRAQALLLFEREGLVAGGDPGASGADIGLVAGAALACIPLEARASSLELGVCGAFELGRLTGEGTRVTIAHEVSVWWLAPGLDAGARWSPWPRGPAIELDLGGRVPLSRDVFELRGTGPVHQPANVVARASLGVRWAFAD